MQAGDLAFHAAPSFLAEIAVELAEQGIAVLLGPVGQVRDEVFHLLAGGIAKRLDPAEIGRIRLDQVGIELMLADDLAESVANRAAAVVSVGRLWAGSFLDSGRESS